MSGNTRGLIGLFAFGKGIFSRLFEDQRIWQPQGFTISLNSYMELKTEILLIRNHRISTDYSHLLISYSDLTTGPGQD